MEDNDYYVYDKEKSDVYVLAMIVLEICFLEPVMGYDAHNRKVNLGTVDIFLGKLRSKYSNNMYDVLKKMLQLDPKLRPSFAAIL